MCEKKNKNGRGVIYRAKYSVEIDVKDTLVERHGSEYAEQLRRHWSDSNAPESEYGVEHKIEIQLIKSKRGPFVVEQCIRADLPYEDQWDYLETNFPIAIKALLDRMITLEANEALHAPVVTFDGDQIRPYGRQAMINDCTNAEKKRVRRSLPPKNGREPNRPSAGRLPLPDETKMLKSLINDLQTIKDRGDKPTQKNLDKFRFPRLDLKRPNSLKALLKTNHLTFKDVLDGLND